jgi:hypothetical protein
MVGQFQVWGQLDVQTGSGGWKMILVSDESTAGNKILGRIDLAGISSGSMGIVGVATGLDVANGGRGQAAGWVTQHPYGHVRAHPGAVAERHRERRPRLHVADAAIPWRLGSGDVNLAAGSGASGNMRMAAGQSASRRSSFPSLDGRTGGRPRSIEGVFVVPATGSYSFAVWSAFAATTTTRPSTCT